MNDSLAMTALSLINDIEKLNWNDHSMSANQKAERFFKRKNKYDNHQQQKQKSFAYQKSKRKTKNNQKSIDINRSFVLQKSNLQQIGEQIIPRIKKEFENNVRHESSICINKHSKDLTRKLEITLIFNYCKKIRKLYYFNKFFKSLKFRLFLQKLNAGIGRIYYKKLSQSLKLIKNENNILKEKSIDLINLQNISHILNKKTIFMKAQSMAKIEIHGKKQQNTKFVYVFMLMVRKTINRKLKYFMKEGFDKIRLQCIK